jgi:hypothetical protein
LKTRTGCNSHQRGPPNAIRTCYSDPDYGNERQRHCRHQSEGLKPLPHEQPCQQAEDGKCHDKKGAPRSLSSIPKTLNIPQGHLDFGRRSLLHCDIAVRVRHAIGKRLNLFGENGKPAVPDSPGAPIHVSLIRAL